MLQTADVDVRIAVEDAEAECLLVCGLSSCFAAVEMDLAADAAIAVAADAAMTVVCGLSSCFAAVAALAADAAMAAEIAVDAN